MDPLAADFKEKLEEYIEAKIRDVVGDIVDERLGDFTVSADSIDGIDSLVSDAISNLTFEVTVS
jgi:hypothetical protein